MSIYSLGDYRVLVVHPSCSYLVPSLCLVYILLHNPPEFLTTLLQYAHSSLQDILSTKYVRHTNNLSGQIASPLFLRHLYQILIDS